MSNINRIEVLEQRFNRGVLTEMEQDELFGLLEQAGELDRWLDSGDRLTPAEDIIYEDKDFLKSIAAPIDLLKPDKSIVYKNKNRLYRRNITFSSINIIKIVAAAAVILFIPIVLQEYAPSDEEGIQDIAVLNSTQLYSTPNIEVAPTVIIDNILVDKPKKQPVSDVKTTVVEKSVARVVVDIVEDVKIAAVENSVVVNIVPVENSVVASVEEGTEDIPIEVLTLSIEPQELVLYVSAEQWSGVSTDIRPQEFVVEHEEWQSSETRRRRMLRRLKERMNHSI